MYTESGALIIKSISQGFRKLKMVATEFDPVFTQNEFSTEVAGQSLLHYHLAAQESVASWASEMLELREQSFYCLRPNDAAEYCQCIQAILEEFVDILDVSQLEADNRAQLAGQRARVEELVGEAAQLLQTQDSQDAPVNFDPVQRAFAVVQQMSSSPRIHRYFDPGWIPSLQQILQVIHMPQQLCPHMCLYA